MIKILKSKKRKKRQQGIYYIDYVLTFDFDITTTSDGKQAYISKWNIQEEESHCGDSIFDLQNTLNTLNSMLAANQRAVIFVRNLSHLFQFLKGIHEFTDEEYFAIDEHKILNCRIDKIEFRCLMLHSNMKMREYTGKYGDTTYKEGGDIVDRCKAMRSAIINEMRIENDDLYSVPDTSTGYVRRDIHAAMYCSFANRKLKENFKFSFDTYNLLDKALRGGNCVANRFYVGEIVKNVKSADRCSAYTDSILNHQYPMGAFSHEGACDWEWYAKLRKRKNACVMQIEFINLRLKNPNNPAPYIDDTGDSYNAVIEGDRIISADYLVTYITDVDLDIIMRQYDMDVANILDLSYARYGKLPEELLDVQRKYYTLKTELKNVKGEELRYMKNKAKNNSIAGIFQQRPIYKKFTIKNNIITEIEQDTEEAWNEVSNNLQSVSFAWGVWTTAWARWELQKAIDLAGDKFIYTDTDSVKYIGDIDWTKLNDDKVAESTSNKGVAKDKKGIPHYVGVWEQEETATEFCMLGQKKYAACHGKKLMITVSGLDKELGGKALQKGDEYGSGIKRFQLAADIPFKFEGCAGGAILYNELGTNFIEYEGVKITSNMVIKPAIFTLGGEEVDDYYTLVSTKLNWISVD